MKSFKEFLQEKVKIPEEQEVYQDKTREHLNAHHDYTKNLSEHEQNHVYDYTKDSEDLNTHLFRQHTNPIHGFADAKPYKETESYKKNTAQYKTKIHHIDSAIAKTKMTKGVDIHSGVKFDVGEEAAKHPDRLLHLPAYTSTTLRPTKAKVFAKYLDNDTQHVISIHVKKGQNALPILHNSRHANEDEVLLPRHTTLKVAARPHKSEVSKSGNTTTHYWKAHIVHQGEE